jgi:hypothetical protein
MATDSQSKKPRAAIRPVTENVFWSLILDVWPNPAGIQDFGLRSDRHYAALQYAVQSDGVTPEELDRALGDGEAITALIRPGNPYCGVTFQTAWDGLGRTITDWAEPEPGVFRLGRIFASHEALQTLSRDDITAALGRHVQGDWGEGERAENDSALRKGGSLFSVYRTKDGVAFWVTTEADRTVTTVQLPEA